MEGKVFRVQEVHNPWVSRGVGVQLLGRTMKNAICALLDEGADSLPLMCGDMGEVT